MVDKPFIARASATWRALAHRFHKPFLLAALTVFTIGTAWAVRNLGITFEQIDGKALALLVCLSPATLLYSGFGLQLMARGAGTSIPLRNATATSAFAILAEALPLPGGAIVRTGALMKAGAGLGQSSLLVLLTAILWIALGALGAGFTLLEKRGSIAWPLVALGLAGTGLTIGWLWRQVGWRLACLMLVHRVSGLALIALRLYLAFRVLGVTFPFWQAMPFVLASIAGSAASIAPAGLGVSEALAAVAATTVAVAPAAAFLAVGIDRIVHLLVSAIAAAPTLIRIWNKQHPRHAGS